MFRSVDPTSSTATSNFFRKPDRFRSAADSPYNSSHHRDTADPTNGGALNNKRGVRPRSTVYEEEPPVYVIGFDSSAMVPAHEDGSLSKGARSGQQYSGRATQPRSAGADAGDVGMALTSNDAISGCPVHGHQALAARRADNEVLAPHLSSAPPSAMPQGVRLLSGAEAPSHLHQEPSNEQSTGFQDTNRVFGLAKDLTTAAADSAHLLRTPAGMPLSAWLQDDELPHAESSTAAQRRDVDRKKSDFSLRSSKLSSRPASSAGKQSKDSKDIASSSDGGLPTQFSVEVVAPFFDKRGYPIFRGRGAHIRGFIRLRPVERCEVVIQLGAHISQGSPAAIWDGIALMPPESGEDRKIFSTRDIIKLNESMLKLKDGAMPTSTDPDDFVYEAPFHVRLPIGVSTQYSNGAPSSVTAVALPPSYEITSSNNQREREADRAANTIRSSAASIRSKSSRLPNLSALSIANAGHGFSNTMQAAVERGFGEVFRIGCFYHMKIILQRTEQASAPSNTGPKWKNVFSKAKPPQPAILDTITVPFIFLGEPTTESLPPYMIPTHLIAPAVARTEAEPLSREWDIETASAKWAGSLLRTTKRNVELELHLPSPPTLHTPCIFPVLLIIRPADARLLSAVPRDALGSSPALDLRNQRSFEFGSQGGRNAQSSRPASVQEQEEMLDSTDDAYAGTNRRQGPDMDHKLSRFMRNRFSTSRKSGTDKNENNSHAPGRASDSRPTTAPTSAGSSSDGRSRASGTTVGPGGAYYGGLCGLVRMSLVQTTFCVASGPSDAPKNLRKLIAMAEVEELDVDSLFSTDGEDGHRDIFAPGPDADALKKAVRTQMQEKGVRVLKGTFRLGTDPTPSFRCHGIEVRYGIKVDLVPFSVKDQIRKGKSAGDAYKTSGSAIGDHSDFGTRSHASLHSVGTHASASMTRGGGASSVAGSRTAYPSAGDDLVGGGGTSTIIAGKAGSSYKLEKGVGSLFASVRVVRGAQS